MAYTEKRRYPRARVDVPVRFGWDERCALAGRVVNVGEGGCLLATGDLAVRGTPIHVRGLVGDDLVIAGEVIYPLEGIGVGVAFHGLSEATREKLRALVKLNAREPG